MGNHVYIIYQKVLEDIKNNRIEKENLKNICYARAYFIDIIKKNPFLQLIKIEKDFIRKFEIDKISSSSVPLIQVDLKKVLASAQLSYKNEMKLSNYTVDSLVNLKDYNNESIIEEIKSEYMKDNIKQVDKLYLIITKNMKNNLSNIKCDTIFVDCTYKCIPKTIENSNFPLLLIRYNRKHNIFELLIASLISMIILKLRWYSIIISNIYIHNLKKNNM